jgi:RimJ/RimL family protein N-acetyltransferase
VKTREDAVVWIDRRKRWDSGDNASWAVEDAETGELVGSVSVHSIDREANDAEIGYWTVPAARGRGVAAAAVDAASRWAFATLPIDRIELCHAVENKASGRVAEKAGYTYEGHLRRSYRYGDGVKHDELLWARLADDPAPDL